MENINLNNKITFLRILCCMDIDELAEKIGIHPKTMGKYEKEGIKDIELIKKIANILNYPEDLILDKTYIITEKELMQIKYEEHLKKVSEENLKKTA
jgi:DNA-binding XRE family transcriptional regulator